MLLRAWLTALPLALCLVPLPLRLATPRALPRRLASAASAAPLPPAARLELVSPERADAVLDAALDGLPDDADAMIAWTPAAVPAAAEQVERLSAYATALAAVVQSEYDAGDVFAARALYRALAADADPETLQAAHSVAAKRAAASYAGADTDELFAIGGRLLLLFRVAHAAGGTLRFDEMDDPAHAREEEAVAAFLAMPDPEVRAANRASEARGVLRRALGETHLSEARVALDDSPEALGRFRALWDGELRPLLDVLGPSLTPADTADLVTSSLRVGVASLLVRAGAALERGDAAASLARSGRALAVTRKALREVRRLVDGAALGAPLSVAAAAALADEGATGIGRHVGTRKALYTAYVREMARAWETADGHRTDAALLRRMFALNPFEASRINQGVLGETLADAAAEERALGDVEGLSAALELTAQQDADARKDALQTLARRSVLEGAGLSDVLGLGEAAVAAALEQERAALFESGLSSVLAPLFDEGGGAAAALDTDAVSGLRERVPDLGADAVDDAVRNAFQARLVGVARAAVACDRKGDGKAAGDLLASLAAAESQSRGVRAAFAETWKVESLEGEGEGEGGGAAVSLRDVLTEVEEIRLSDLAFECNDKGTGECVLRLMGLKK